MEQEWIYRNYIGDVMKIINTLENMDLSTSNLVEAYWEIDILKDIYFITIIYAK